MLGRSQVGNSLFLLYFFYLILYMFYFSLFIAISLCSFVTCSVYHEEWRLGGSPECAHWTPVLVPNTNLFCIPTVQCRCKNVKENRPSLSLQSIQGSMTLIRISNYTVTSSMQMKSREDENM